MPFNYLSFSELEHAIAAGANVTPSKAREWVARWRELVIDEMVDGYEIPICLIGKMYARKYWRNNATSPRTGLPIGPRLIKTSRFTPSKAMRDALN